MATCSPLSLSVSSFISSHPLLPLPLFSHPSRPSAHRFLSFSLPWSQPLFLSVSFIPFRNLNFYHVLSFHIRPIFLTPIKAECAVFILTLPAVLPGHVLQQCLTPDFFLNIKQWLVSAAVSESDLRCLKLAQNAAAVFLTKTPKSERLPNRSTHYSAFQWFLFQKLLMVIPQHYLSEILVLLREGRGLRSWVKIFRKTRNGRVQVLA